MTDYEVPNLDALPADELLAVARHAVMLLVDQLSEPSAVHDFEPLTHRDPASDWGAMLAESPRESPMESHTESPSVPGEPAPPHPRSLPCLHRRSEELGRAVGSLLTVLAGHTDRLFE